MEGWSGTAFETGLGRVFSQSDPRYTMSLDVSFSVNFSRKIIVCWRKIISRYKSIGSTHSLVFLRFVNVGPDPIFSQGTGSTLYWACELIFLFSKQKFILRGKHSSLFCFITDYWRTCNKKNRKAMPYLQRLAVSLTLAPSIVSLSQ